MGKSQVKATLCPNCSYEHVIVPMFKTKKENTFVYYVEKLTRKELMVKLYLYQLKKIHK